MLDSKYLSSNVQFVELLIPDLGNAVLGPVNIVNIGVLDQMLVHLEAFVVHNGVRIVPSPIILHILLLLAARLPMTLVPSSAQRGAQTTSAKYQLALHKPPMHTRALGILRSLGPVLDDILGQLVHSKRRTRPNYMNDYYAGTEGWENPESLDVVATQDDDNTSDPEEVSDSEDSDVLINRKMVEELRKLKQDSVTERLGSVPTGLGQASDFLLSRITTPSSSIPPSPRRKRNVNLVEAVSIVDQPLLCKHMHDRQTTLWALLQWTFWTLTMETRAYRGSFDAYSGLLTYLFEYLLLNKTLYGLLVAQLSPTPADYDDRVVEYLFTGLTGTTYEPPALFEKEKFILKHEREPHPSARLLSVSLRFLVLAQYFSHLGRKSSTNLVSLTSLKLLQVEYPEFEAFFSIDTLPHISTSTIKTFKLQLCQAILERLTSIVEIDTYFANPPQILLKDIFGAICDDETIGSWPHFYTNWLKANLAVVVILQDVTVDDTEVTRYRQQNLRLFHKAAKAWGQKPRDVITWASL